jgi:hypothetical protein
MSEREPVGSVTEEAAKLADALTEWSGRSSLAQLADSNHIATDAPECEWCPVCRAIRAVRGTAGNPPPEVTRQLEEAVLALRGILRMVRGAHSQRGRGSWR